MICYMTGLFSKMFILHVYMYLLISAGHKFSKYMLLELEILDVLLEVIIIKQLTHTSTVLQHIY